MNNYKEDHNKVSEAIAKKRLDYLTHLYHDKEEWKTRKEALKWCMITAFGLDN